MKAALRGVEDADMCPPRWPSPPAHTAQVCFSSYKDVKKVNKTRAIPSSSLIEHRTNEVGGNFTFGRGDDAWHPAPCGLAAPCFWKSLLLSVEGVDG